MNWLAVLLVMVAGNVYATNYVDWDIIDMAVFDWISAAPNGPFSNVMVFGMFVVVLMIGVGVAIRLVKRGIR